MIRQIEIFDTTLRDGTQSEGISLSVHDKIKIAKQLDALGVHYIEGGNPGSNQKDREFFHKMKDFSLNSRLTAFGMTRRKYSLCEQDSNLQNLLSTYVKTACIVGKTWDFHVRTALQTTLEENICMIEETIHYLVQKGVTVLFDAEHFFDGFKQNPTYTTEVIKRAKLAGAYRIVLCDTNGGGLPHEIIEIISLLPSDLNGYLGIHAHNDGELAVANTIAAVQAGAVHVQGTINGYGERCGNANLCSVLPNLQLKLGMHCLESKRMADLTAVARYVSEISNVSLPIHQPFVGYAAFSHKGGLHVSAILRDSRTYEHISPSLVGNEQRVLVSELSGQSNLISKLSSLGIKEETYQNKLHIILETIKNLEHQGYQFEGADASLELLVRSIVQPISPFFSIKSFNVSTSFQKKINTEASVTLLINEQEVFNTAEGIGPVHALDCALRKSLIKHYPELEAFHLRDYKVRVMDGQEATAAKVHVWIESEHTQATFHTIGVSANLIEASCQALIDSFQYALFDMKNKKHSAV